MVGDPVLVAERPPVIGKGIAMSMRDIVFVFVVIVVGLYAAGINPFSERDAYRPHILVQ